ncbi:hypothetical protein DV532_26815 (plasmid) [Pseudomonas sp. Leaf58]|uniref:DEAD/DEAH box helicase family protein n=1 Tax=Pseudomonas sp. Leaf58 TaxID=1736226 RepID=UPI0006F8845B|nr:DEAD/DEAH box helicase family protein [Pseudomonas sp. Leaf58]AYG47898.1 hypothetical protein DV532_26815 [Pseudomonas sp. Leaf58]KQN62537.1 hypothetical protein ASF02_10345 [Pseudomonas sp. Leaf58]
MQNEYVSAVKTHASVLVEHLNRYGIKLKKTQAIEVIANLQGQTDWNRVRAKLTGVEKKLMPELPAGAKPLRAMILLGRPGIGKTEALKTIVELEQADSQTNSLFICLSGSAHVYLDEQDSISYHSNNFDVHYSSTGIIKTTGRLRLPNKPILINMISDERGSRHGLKQSLISFLIQNKELFQSVRIGSVLIDELHCLQAEEEREIIETVAWFSATLPRPIRQLVMVSQVIPSFKTAPAGVDLKLLVDSQFPLAMDWKPNENLSFPHESVGQVYTRPLDGMGYWEHPHLPWRSQSIDDEFLVKDIFNAVILALIEEKSERRIRVNGTTRLRYVLGESIWFRDLRADLLRL